METNSNPAPASGIITLKSNNYTICLAGNISLNVQKLLKNNTAINLLYAHRRLLQKKKF
jgi:hypothetical protein